MLMALGLAMFSSLVFAQGTDVLAPYRDFKPPEDMATRLMEGLLGATYTSPFTAGIQTNTLFGAIFMVFNIIVFAVGTVFASYGVVAGIVQTAHEGVVMGKRMSAIWMPVRMVTGIGGLIPAFGGFSLSQVAMIVATSWGISFGNFAYNEALTAANRSATLVNASFSRTDSSKDANAMAQALFLQRLCEVKGIQKLNELRAENQVPAPDQQMGLIDINLAVEGRGTRVGRSVGTQVEPAKCGAVGIERKNQNSSRDSSSTFGFRSSAVNYEAINQQAWSGYADNFPIFVGKVHLIADKYIEDLKSTNSVPVYPTEEIRAAGITYVGSVQSTQVARKNISEEAYANMKTRGFFSAGSFYAVHAEVSAAVIQASDATELIVIMPGATAKAASISSGDYDGAYAGMSGNNSEMAAVNNKENGFLKAICLSSTPGNTATGSCSIGQKVVSLMLDGGTAGAGGSSTMVDPIIAMKNIGDYFMSMGITILSASTVGNIVASMLPDAATSAMGKANPVGGALLELGKGLLSILPYIGGMFLAVGALCSLYIPMVPFINWVSGLVQYCCIVVESFAAAPLWAFAHLQADGEGMGQRTERGYLYLINLLFRPILMVVAFFAASALVILLGSLVFQMFAPAMSAAQGNSITGLFSIIGYVFMFFVIMNIIIQGLFDLVMQLPDDVIGWVGGVGSQKIGKDAEGKISAAFVAGGRFGAAGGEKVAAAASGKGGGGGGKPTSNGSKIS